MEANKKKTLVSLFSGCGGMDIGFEGGFFCFAKEINRMLHPDWIVAERGNEVLLSDTGFETIFANDIQPSAKAVWVSYFRTRYSDADLRYHLGSIVDLVKKERAGEAVLPKEADVVTGGFPCLSGDALVATDKGLVRLDTISLGDKVLSHDGLYHKVVGFYDQGIKDVYQLSGYGFESLFATGNHRFYVREKRRVKIHGHYEVMHSDPKWMSVEEILQKPLKTMYIGNRMDDTGVLPVWKGITSYVNRTATCVKCTLKMDDTILWYLVGKYLANGWVRKSHKKGTLSSTYSGVVFSCKKETAERFEEVLKTRFSFFKIEEKNVIKYVVSSLELAHFLLQFGDTIYTKHLPGFVFQMPKQYLEYIIEGYLDGDGSVFQNIVQFVTVSRELAYGISTIFEKAYELPCQIYKEDNPPTRVIDDRLVVHSDYYIIRCRFIVKQQTAFYEKGFVWRPIRKIEKAGKMPVYDIEVEDTHSFIANRCITHNCQDFSVAGKRLGFQSQTSHTGKVVSVDEPTVENRGHLYFWMREVISLVKPKLFVAENVKGLVHLADIKKIIEHDFAEAGNGGYLVVPAKVVVASSYGVPQHRERVLFFGFKKEALRPEALDALIKDQIPPEYDPYPAITHGEGIFPMVTCQNVFTGLLEPSMSLDMSQQKYSRAKYMGTHCQGQIEIKLDSVGPTVRAEHHGNIEFRRLSKEHGGRLLEELEQGLQERRLSVRECARLQTFPDICCFVMNKDTNGVSVSMSDAYRLIGNAVPPVLAYCISKNLQEKWNRWFIDEGVAR